MSVAKVIQHLSLSNNEIQEVRLQDAPTLNGVGLKGKFGIDSTGAFVYIAGYDGSAPIINKLRELITSSETSDGPILNLVKSIEGHKDAISINIPALLAILFKEEISATSGWTSFQIVDYITETLKNLPKAPYPDDTLTVGMTSVTLNSLYPIDSFPPGTQLYSATAGIQYTRLSGTLWRQESIDII